MNDNEPPLEVNPVEDNTPSEQPPMSLEERLAAAEEKRIEASKIIEERSERRLADFVQIQFDLLVQKLREEGLLDEGNTPVVYERSYSKNLLDEISPTIVGREGVLSKEEVAAHYSDFFNNEELTVTAKFIRLKTGEYLLFYFSDRDPESTDSPFFLRFRKGRWFLYDFLNRGHSPVNIKKITFKRPDRLSRDTFIRLMGEES